AAWTFVIWGAFHGALLMGERWRAERRDAAPAETGGQVWVRRLVTFHLVCLGWVLCRADSMARVGEILGRLFQWRPAPSVTPAVLALIIGGIAVRYLPRDFRLQVQVGFSRLRPLAMTGVLAGFLLFLDGL